MQALRPAALAGAAHPGPSLAVTALSAGYASTTGLPARYVVLVTAAVATGQLSIGWANDLVDVGRDRAVGRTDKPLATGEVSVRAVALCCGAAVACTVVLSLLCGPLAGAVHLLLVVGSGWAYDLGLKATPLSWLPYAVAFGALPVFLSLAGPDGARPPAAVALAGALLGVGAHLVNALPDLADDEATGVRGLPHLVGAVWTRRAAVAALGAATLLLILVVAAPLAVSLLVGAAALGLVAVALVAEGRAPFRAAVGVALLAVALLVAAG